MLSEVSTLTHVRPKQNRQANSNPVMPSVAPASPALTAGDTAPKDRLQQLQTEIGLLSRQFNRMGTHSVRPQLGGSLMLAFASVVPLLILFMSETGSTGLLLASLVYAGGLVWYFRQARRQSESLRRLKRQLHVEVEDELWRKRAVYLRNLT